MSKPDYEIHEYCDIFPDLDAKAIAEMAASIAAEGQLDPIIRWGTIILDGKNRLKACDLAGVSPIFESWYPTNPADKQLADDEAWAFCRAKNYNRRHLTTSQLSMIAGKELDRRCANLHTETTVQEVADKHGVSKRSVDSAKKVIANGSTELQHAVTNGHVTVSDAANIVDKPKPKQNAAVAAVVNGKAKTVTEAVREPGDETENDKSKLTTDDEPTINVPASLKQVAESLKGFRASISAVGKVREQIRELCEAPGGNKVARLWSDMERMFEQISVNLKSYRFWAACPECKITDQKKKADEGCKMCRGHGWIAKTNGLSDHHKTWLRERGYEC